MEPPADDSAQFIDQARWLLEWHNRRSEAFMTRAAALLGFVGVVLALLLQGADLGGIEPTAWTWTLLVATLIALLVTGFNALRTIRAEQISAPSVQDLRHWWGKHAQEPHPGRAGPQIAESLLNSARMNEVSAVSAAMEDAERRAKTFKHATSWMLVSFVLLALLLCNVLLQAREG